MGTEVTALTELSKAEIDAWRELAASAVGPNPFFEPEYVLPAAKALDGGDVGLVIVRDGSDWRACLPVRSTRGWHRIPLRAVVAWHHLYCFLGTPLLHPGSPAEDVAQLVRGLNEDGHDFIGLDAVGSEVAEAIATAATGIGFDPILFERRERAALRWRDGGEPLGLSSKHRRNFERLRRNAETDLGEPLVAVDRSGEPEAVESFLRLETSGWKGRNGTAVASNESHTRFFREMCAGFADLGRLQLLSLEAGSRVVAMKCNIRAGDGLFCIKIAFDESLSRYSPGVQLEIDNVAAFHDREGLTWMDSCAESTNQMINRLWPGRIVLETLAIPAPGVRGVVAKRAIHVARRARDLVRSG